MDWSYLLNSFDGRISRKTFWIAMGAVTVAEIFGHILAEEIQGDRLSAIVDLAYTYPEFAIAVPFTVLGVALLVELGFRRGTIGPNQYGPDPLAPGPTPRT